MSTLRFFIADYDDARHAQAVLELLDAYARDPMGGGEALSDFARDNLIAALAATPGAFSVLGLQEEQPVALANCFRSLSTFACRPLINIHDLMVLESARGQGISQQLLSFIEAHAIASRCCKVTLEVLEGNRVARQAYERFGFAPYTLGDEAGHALFMQKSLLPPV